jgi:formylglycine-generating enzyme required for sulfatase activity
MPLMVGRFTIEDQLGAGGMGRVYLAYDPTLDRKVALKLIHGEGDNERAHARLAREARAMARLSHPNVVTVHEVGKHEGQLFIVMELVAGGTLRGWLETSADKVDWQPIVDKLVLAGRGLAAAHAAGLVHRDFKPDNVLLDGDRVLVSDFGIANVYGDTLESDGSSEPASGRAPLTRTGAILGTPPYMAPEQHLGERTDSRTDQFAFCIVLYEALYGVRPFAGADIAAIAMAAQDTTLTPPVIERDVPAHIHAAMLRGLSPDPAKRFPTMTMLLAELAPPAKPRRRAWPLAAGAIAVTAVLVVWLATRDRAPSALAAGPPCDCETITFAPPPGGLVHGGNQLAVTRGHQLVAYAVDGATYLYSVVSRGINHERTIALPAPERRAGFAFVPGGEVPLGDLEGDGDKSEQPVGYVHLDPYSIAIREDGPMKFDEARKRATGDGDRLPFAAEWEWAARLGVIEDALGHQWEWTATTYGAYPHVDDRDDPLADGQTIEVRGGQKERCDRPGKAACNTDSPADRPRVSRRLNGARAGTADLRRARTVVVPEEVTFERDDKTTRHVGLGRLRRWIAAQLSRARDPAVQVRVRGKLNCVTDSIMGKLRGDRMEIIHDPTLPDGRIVVRLHPDQKFERERRRVWCGETQIDVLDVICFDGVLPTASSDASINAMASTLRNNPAIQKLEVAVYVAPDSPDPVKLSQQRAEVVRARLIAMGVEPDRLVARGEGPSASNAVGLDELQATPTSCRAGDRVELRIVKRDPT